MAGSALQFAFSFSPTLVGNKNMGEQLHIYKCRTSPLAINEKGVNSMQVVTITGDVILMIIDNFTFVVAIEAPWDPTTEISRLISEHKYEEAFNIALQRSDVSIVSWLCSQVDLQRILLMVPLPLSQGVLLSLLQQIACDISKDTSRKFKWMTEVAVAINPADPMLSMHVRPIFEQVYQIVNHHRSLPTTSSADITSTRVVIHVLNSMLMACK
ncbi:hypothetical protein Vadar_016350 [Vaccinium darrowii]|uniref:Uncharacterized protein n=1 Tax=Vaccinium darrowii TaxID=229202 RepID=A0ACB7XR48_9ERIC|nr:hypothetical protein Vadar_016350 [Vaccinium darrowii]